MVKNPFFSLFGGMTQWLYQRFSAFCLYFFIGYLIFNWIQIDQLSYQVWVDFFQSVIHRSIITISFLITFFHVCVGVQLVFDDYITNKWMNQVIYLILLLSMVLQIIFLFLFLLDI